MDELAQVRDDLIASRSTTVWATLYPSGALATEPPFAHAIAGARRSIQDVHLPGIKAMLPAGNVLDLLRADAEHCASALTVEQAAEIQGTSVGAISGKEAVWHDRQYEHEQERKQKKAAIEAYIQEWGFPPPEWT